jgi:hypothetical protein
MPNEVIVEINPYKAARHIEGMDEKQAGRFVEVVRRAYAPEPKPADLNELRKWLALHPSLWRGVLDLAESVKSNLVARIVSDDAARIALISNVASIREELGYSSASALEKLLIENIVVAWLRNEWLEMQTVRLMGNGETPVSVVEFWERRLSASQHRYLSACQTLAKIRRLASKYPNLQVNIATQNGQQVNVAGDLIKQKRMGQE